MKALVIHASVPALYLGAYGNEAVRTPALDQLAARGIVFDAHETDGAAPEQFLNTFLTGRHGFGQNTEVDLPVLLDQLGRSEIPTILFSTKQERADRAWTEADCLPGETHATPILEAVADLLDRHVDRPSWLLVLDLGRLAPGEWAAPETEPPPPIAQQPEPEIATEPTGNIPGELEDVEFVDDEDVGDDLDDIPEADSAKIADELADDEIVDSEVQALLEGQAELAADVEEFDVFLQWLLGELEEHQLTEDLAIILTGQATAVRPDGLCSAGPAHPLRPSISRLPLIVQLPGDRHAGKRIATLTQPADLTASVLSLFGQEIATTQGISLASLWSGAQPARREYVCAANNTDNSQSLALTTPAWKYLRSISESGEAKHWLFRLPEDRFGMLDVYQQHLEFAERLEACAQNYLAAAREAGQVAAPALPSEFSEDASPST
jgi:arylsulfatase A-like enzyme